MKRRQRARHLGPERRRPLVIDAATIVFARDGYQGASMATVAERADISKAVLYDCFPGGKKELHTAVLERAADRCIDAVLPALDAEVVGSPAEAIIGCTRGVLAFAEDDPDAFRLLFAGAPGGGGEAVKRTSAARNRAIGEISRRALFVLAAMGDGMRSR